MFRIFARITIAAMLLGVVFLTPAAAQQGCALWEAGGTGSFNNGEYLVQADATAIIERLSPTQVRVNVSWGTTAETIAAMRFAFSFSGQYYTANSAGVATEQITEAEMAARSKTFTMFAPESQGNSGDFSFTMSVTGHLLSNPSERWDADISDFGNTFCTSPVACPSAGNSSFSASPSSIIQGQSSTLSWNVPNAESVTISGIGTFGASGSVVVSPSSTTTYTLTATGASGCPAIQLQTTVAVANCPSTAGSSFAAAPSNIIAGQNSTLTWNVPNATSVVIAGVGTFGPSGSVAVTPGSTTTYTLTGSASGCADVTLQATVNVTYCQTITSFSASSTSIPQGQSTTLSYTLANANSATITDLSTGVVTNVPVQSGSLVVTPDTTRTYRLTVAGACATITQDLTINVTPCQTISSFGASATTINQGQSTVLSYVLTGATAASIMDLSTGTVTNVPVQSGSLAVTPASTRTYRLSAVGPCATVTQDITINVTACQTITSFAASPTTVTQGQSTTFTYNLTGATSATITDLTSGTATSVPVQSGTLTVTPTSTRTYRLSVFGPCATVNQDIPITVTACQTISSFGASSTTITQGQSTTLSYVLTGATSATITDLSTGAVASVPVQSGSLIVTPSTTRTYRLSAVGPCATVTQDITINVTTCQTISSYTASATTIAQGQSSILSYDLAGATSATITDLTSGTVTSVPVPSGTLTVTPATTRTYRLSAVGSCATVTQDITINVTACQAISSFGASATIITQGQSTTLTYTLVGATSATITDLSTGVVTNVPVQSGSLVVTPSTTRTYRLSAVGPCATVTQDLTISVSPCQLITSFTASASTITVGQSTTLSYNLAGATSATITDLTSGTVTSVAVQSGTLVVTPASTRTYRLSAAGPCANVTQDLPITVNPAPCPTEAGSSFTASPSAISVGQSSTLTWNVPNAESVTISGVGTFGPSGNVSVTPGSTTTYTLTSAASGCSPITLQTTVTVAGATSCQVINSFTVSSNSVNPGETITFTWNLTGATSASITNLNNTSQGWNVPVQSGSLTITPTGSATYKLIAYGPCNSPPPSAELTVAVCAKIVSFTASSTVVNVGQSVTFSYTVTNAYNAVIYDSLSGGAFTPVPVPSGTLTVTPASTRDYTITASGDCGSVYMTIPITVIQPPVINSFDAAAPSICPGATTQLTWSATGGTTATISAPGLPGSPVSVSTNSGSLTISPASTTTYTLTETNSAGSTSQQVTVTVLPSTVINTFTASAGTITQGSSTTLSYTLANATSATITDLTSGTVTSVPVQSGSLAVSPATTRNYRLSATGTCGTVTQDLTITVTPCQTISSFTASATTINIGQSTTLSYVLTGATSATITDLSTGVVTNVAVQSGSLIVTPATTRTYRLSSIGPCATATRDLVITVNPPGQALIGPQGQPGAVGPTGTNDDYTNRTLLTGVAVPYGGVTTAGGIINFTNTVRNPQAVQADTYTLSASSIPAGFSVTVDAGAGFVSLNGGATTTLTVAASSNSNITVRITAPAGISVLNGFSTIIRATSGLTPSAFNETIDRVWTGYVRADKSQVVTNSTGIGAPTEAVPGAVIEYIVVYTNVTATSGTNNIDLPATNVILIEDGNAAPNNWGTTTNHVAGSATDSLGGAITGDVAGSSLLTDTVPTLAPGQSGTLRFRRIIK